MYKYIVTSNTFLLRNAKADSGSNDSSNTNYADSSYSSYCVFHGAGYTIKAFHCRVDKPNDGRVPRTANNCCDICKLMSF